MLDDDGMDTQLARSLHRSGRLDLSTLRGALDQVRRARQEGAGPTLARALAQRGLLSEGELAATLGQLRRSSFEESGEGTFELRGLGRSGEAAPPASEEPPPDDTPTQHVKGEAAAEGAPSVESFRPGGQVGDFVLERQAGAGAMGLVFVARNAATGARVALKTVRASVSEDPQLVERFRREADVLAKVDGHENIVRVLATGSSQGRPYFIMELVEGGTLVERVRHGPLETAEAVRVLAGVARGLAHLHARGVVHRDVKPSNIVLDATGVPKLVDFGLAAGSGVSRLTATGELMGTPQFMAPEQVVGGREDVGPWTDVWALGAVLFFALVGRSAFTATNAIALLEEISTGEPPSLLAARPTTPAAIDALYRACLARDIRARPQAAEVVRMLDGLAASLTPAGAVGTRSRRVAVQVVGVVAAVAGAFALGRQSADPPPQPPRAAVTETEEVRRAAAPPRGPAPTAPAEVEVEVEPDPGASATLATSATPAASVAPATSTTPVRPPRRAGTPQDDAAAQRLLQDASAHWNDPTPEAALALAERALAATSSPSSNRLVRGTVLLFVATLHQAKTGRLDEALERCEEVVALLQGASSPDARALLARAMVLEASIIYDTRGDHEAALELYRRAQEATQLASTADTAAQLSYRVARAPGRDDASRARYLDQALRLSREAIDLVPAQVAAGPGRARTLARYRLQLVLTLFALGLDEEARTERAAIPPGDLDDNCLYQLALLAAVTDDLAGAGETLARALALRPTAEKRNLLRAFVRGEPDFRPGLAREDWRVLMTDEPVR